MKLDIAWFGFETWPRIIGLLSVGVVGIGAIMAREGRMMVSRGAGIVAFELAGDSDEAEAIMLAWGPEGRRAAIRSLILDYLWILFYVAALAVASLYVATVADTLGWELMALLGALLAAGALLAGFFDALENFVLLRELASEPTEMKVQLARTFAVIKFALVGVVLAYLGIVRGSAWLFGA